MYINPLSPPPPKSGHPFLIENRFTPKPGKFKDFKPEARAIVTEALRTSGLLQSLTAVELRLLLLLLTYATPNGRILAPVERIASDLGITVKEAQRQLAPLVSRAWEGSPILRRHDLEKGQLGSGQSGAETYSLSPHVVGTIAASMPDRRSEQPVPGHPLASREIVLAASRGRYGTPVEIVERGILRQMGIHPEESAQTDEGQARRGLRDAGVAREDIDRLVQEFGIAACRRQVEWLPLRGAKNSSRFLVAAIEGNYDPPRGRKLTEAELQSAEVPPLNLDILNALPDVPEEIEAGSSDNPDHYHA